MKASELGATDRVRAAADSIRPVRSADLAEAAYHLDQLTKPLGSLGKLESLAAQLIAVRGKRIKLPLQKAIYVFAANHGVARAGVSAYPPEVTVQMVKNFLQGGGAINVLARQHEADLTVVDVGVDADFDASPRLRALKVRRGSRNFLEESAMTEAEMSAALEAGLGLAEEAHAQRADLVVSGEMGIGNTTAASAITAMLTDRPPAEVTGKGTGLDEAGWNRKLDLICRAAHFDVPVQVRPGLREIGFGNWEGLRWQEIKQRFPSEWQAWIDRYPAGVTPSGERYDSFLGRLQHEIAFLTELAESQSIAAVTHGGFIRTALGLCGLPSEEAHRLSAEYGAIVDLPRCMGPATAEMLD